MRMPTYRDACQQNGLLNAPSIGANDRSDKDSVEFYIFKNDDIVPDEWLAMQIESRGGPLPAGPTLEKLASEKGYTLYDMCSGLTSLWADEEIFCPSLTKRIVFFKPNTSGKTAYKILSDIFLPLWNPKTGYKVWGGLATTSAFTGNFQEVVDSSKSSQEMLDALRESSEAVGESLIAFGDSAADFIKPDEPTFWTWKNTLVVGILAIGAGFLGIKYGVPAWQRLKGKRKR